MSSVRIHIVMGTVELPNRNLQHDEVSHDQIDIPSEAGWHLEEIEMTKTGRVGDRVGGQSAQVGPFLGASNVWSTQFFKYRAVFTEIIQEDAQATEQTLPEIASGEPEVADAIVIEEGDNTDVTS